MEPASVPSETPNCPEVRKNSFGLACSNETYATTARWLKIANQHSASICAVCFPDFPTIDSICGLE